MIANLAIGVIESEIGPHLAARIDDHAIDLFALAGEGILPLAKSETEVFDQPDINAFLDLGVSRHREIYAALAELYRSDAGLLLEQGVPLNEARLRLAVAPGDFVDFYASRHHAERCAKLTGDANVLPEAWEWMPLAYHSRAAGIIGSGAEVTRPSGWTKSKSGWAIRQCRMLDFETELGFIMRQGTARGEQLTPEEFDDAVFGAVLVCDWSARDLQAAEGKPLGPFHAKAFATQLGNWIVPIEVLAQCRKQAGDLRPDGRRPVKGDLFDIEFKACVRNGAGVEVIAGKSNFLDMSWTPAEMMTHLTQSGAPVRRGDLFASGTISGPEPYATGCLLERQAERIGPLLLDGQERHFLADGNELIIEAHMASVGLPIAFDTLNGAIIAQQLLGERGN